MKKALLLLLVTLLAFFSFTACFGGEEPPIGPPGDRLESLPEMNAVTFSIGKADATLLYTAEHAVLIDAGETEDAAEILRYLRRKGIERLDALFITHFDKDHVGGAAEILHCFPVTAVYTTYESKASAEVDAYHAALTEKGLLPTVLRKNTALTYGDMQFTVYPPEHETYPTKESNNSSLVLHLTYGQTRFLFAGDAEELRVSELLDETALACDLLKVPYHGNDLDNLPQLLALVRPTYGIVTCSDKNPEEAGKTEALRQAGVRVYLTRYGDVEFSSDGINIRVTQ